MTYTFKLAKRLALSRYLALIPLFLFLFSRCSPDDPLAPTSADPSVRPGIAFGAFHVPNDQYGVRSYTGALRALSLSSAAADLSAAKAKGFRLVVSLPERTRYVNADGTFSLSLWKAQMDRWSPSASLLAEYFADGTIIGNYLIDEPYCASCWGGKMIAYADVEEMGRYAKTLLPTLPTIVRAHPGWLRQSGFPWQSIDITWAQYEGPLHFPSHQLSAEQFRDKNVTDAKALGMGLIFGMNTLDGGDGSSGIGGTFAPGLRWQMTAAEVRRNGQAFANEPYACAVIDWRYSPTYNSSSLPADQLAAVRAFDDRTDVKASLAEVAAYARARAVTPCKR